MDVDKRPVTFIILAVLTILIGTLLTTFIPLFMGTATPSLEKVIPYKPLEVEGRDIYIREGCNNCHTQTVRPLPFETARYGPPSLLEESAIDRPHLWGSKRTGPDLARVGTKVSCDLALSAYEVPAEPVSPIEHAGLCVARGQESGFIVYEEKDVRSRVPLWR